MRRTENVRIGHAFFGKQQFFDFIRENVVPATQEHGIGASPHGNAVGVAFRGVARRQKTVHLNGAAHTQISVAHAGALHQQTPKSAWRRLFDTHLVTRQQAKRAIKRVINRSNSNMTCGFGNTIPRVYTDAPLCARRHHAVVKRRPA